MNAPSPSIRFKTKKLLTRPVLKFIVDEPRYVKIESAIYLGKEMKVAPGEKKKEPAHLADVIDLTNGELAQIIINAVPMSVLNESYPDNGYVGKCFSITRMSRQPGKDYDRFRVEEIEEPSSEDVKASQGESTNTAAQRPVGGKPK